MIHSNTNVYRIHSARGLRFQFNWDTTTAGETGMGCYPVKITAE